MRAKVERCQGVTSLENVSSKPSENDRRQRASKLQLEMCYLFPARRFICKNISLNHAGFKVVTSSRLINVSLWLLHSFKQTC